jgi:hypothetical protein
MSTSKRSALASTLSWSLVLASFASSVAARAQPGAAPARATPAPNGPDLVRLLGARAVDAFTVRGAPSRALHAQVVLPAGTRASDLGLPAIVPGFARFTGTPAGLLAFAGAHPELRIEVAPPLHTLLNDASAFVFANQPIAQGMDGTGAIVGIADTGLDVTHPDFLDAQGHTRVAWLLDLSAAPLGIHPDLEQQFGVTDATGALLAGAVWSAADIDAAIAAGKTSTLPQDPVGHGTLVTACAAGNGESGKSAYRGIAPGATIVLARVTGSSTDSIDTDDLLRGAGFLFDRASAMAMPIVVNLSLGSDFGPHDGTMAWEQALAAFVGPDHPGRAIVAAAGNSGSISPSDGPLVHQSVHVNGGTTMRVPIPTAGASSGGVEVWVAMHAGADLSVGLDGPDGRWLAPTASGASAGRSSAGYTAGVYNGGAANSPVPAQSLGAVIVWQGAWPAGTYSVTLDGTGTADLFVESSGDAVNAQGIPDGFAEGVREGTINLPATNPSIIGVGCTINKRSWLAIDQSENFLQVPLLDAVGGLPNADSEMRSAIEGEPCWFSSAGPTLTGVQKPEIMAPGAAIVGALSQQAIPPAPASIFENDSCQGSSDQCEVIDSLHGVSAGTSFSSPIVAGTVAVLLQHDPTLTQGEVLAALQGGSHPLRGPAAFEDQVGAGEVDVEGALAAVDRLHDTNLVLPVEGESWLAFGADEYLADGSTPLEVAVELRAARPASGGSAPPADGFAEARLDVYALVDGRPYEGAVQTTRRGAGVWAATVVLPGGLGGSSLTVGANFDGAPIVASKTVPIAADIWSAEYPTRVQGGCAVGPGETGGGGAGLSLVVGAFAVVALRGRTKPRRECRRRRGERGG